jgi:hypothetical protein
MIVLKFTFPVGALGDQSLVIERSQVDTLTSRGGSEGVRRLGDEDEADPDRKVDGRNPKDGRISQSPVLYMKTAKGIAGDCKGWAL